MSGIQLHANMETAIPEKEQELKEAQASLTAEMEKVAEANAAREKKLKDTMLSDKEHLVAFTDVNERAANKKNIGGVLLLVLGVLATVATCFYRSSYGVDSDNLIFYGGLGLGVLLLILGIIITIVIFKQRKKAQEALEDRDTYLQRLAYSERAYQGFLRGESGTHETVTNEAARVSEIVSMESGLKDLQARMENVAKENDENRRKKEQLTEEYEAQKAVRAELKALDIAIGTLGKLAGLGEESEESILSEEATDILLHMDEKRDSMISIENDIIFVNENGRRVLFSDLSTSSMQEVLFAVRLAILNRLDTRKELPLILDESFANLDGERLQSAMKYVRECGRQAILFSCQPREKKEMAR